MTLTKDDIVEAVAEQIGFPKKQSVELVETLLELIKKTLVSGDYVLVSDWLLDSYRSTVRSQSQVRV